MIKNIIFDVGNVLVDWDVPGHFHRMGYTEEEKKYLWDAIYGSEMWVKNNLGIVEIEEMIDGFVANDPAHEDLIRAEYSAVEGTILHRPYAKGWVQSMKDRGFKVYILSNYGLDHFERTKEKMDFLPLMDGIVFSFDCHLVKPDLAIYQYILNTYGLDPGESVFIDDVKENVETARRLGIHALQYESFEQAKERLELLIQLHDMDDRMCYCME